MTYPFPVAKLRASALNDAIAFGRLVYARKTVDETVNNSSTLQDDDELFVSVEANAVYEMHLSIIYQSNATPDFQWKFSFPTGLTINYWLVYYSTADVLSLGSFAETTTPSIGGSGANRAAVAQGVVIVGSTAGTMQFRWAQASANASDTIVRAGSFLFLTRLT